MGLGKTLQTLCIIATDHYFKKLEFEKGISTNLFPSLIVCPTTLISHWFSEMKHFFSDQIIKPVLYIGNQRFRYLSIFLISILLKFSFREEIKNGVVLITSYNIVRSDIEILSSMNFNYCVLDEGHLIKNSKAKISQAVKKLKSNHRLILSGTPIQNNVLELWSLFDFLMPGFLGTENQFYHQFQKPILAMHSNKATVEEYKLGQIALDTLHKQVLPFILRRTKKDVLRELPPKIIQDYYCELSPIQKTLYEEVIKRQAKPDSNLNIFQLLQLLIKVCNHPILVSNLNWLKEIKAKEELDKIFQTIECAPKLIALKDLLQACDIGIEKQESYLVNTPLPHKALIFAQHTKTLDCIEQFLFKLHLPNLSYLRLDGTVPLKNRFEIVQNFNQDLSIEVLLLTTKTGGLGLNLSAADTVIFIDHNWNPTVDLQAMDRAHRIGVQRIVNVYRIITLGTLEEKIMK